KTTVARGADGCLSVELPATADRCEETLLVKVTQVSAPRGGQWWLGCALVSELSEDTVLALVSQGASRQDTEDVRLAPPPGGGPSNSGRGSLEKVVANVRFCAVAADGSPLWFTARRVFPRVAWPLPGGRVSSSGRGQRRRTCRAAASWSSAAGRSGGAGS